MYVNSVWSNYYNICFSLPTTRLYTKQTFAKQTKYVVCTKVCLALLFSNIKIIPAIHKNRLHT